MARKKISKGYFQEMEDRNAMGAFSRFVRGNVRLQKGKLVTKRDIEERLARIEERSRRYNDWTRNF